MPSSTRNDLQRAYDMTSGQKLRRIVECIRSASIHAVIVFRFRHWLRTQSILVRILCSPFSLYLDYRMRSAWGIEIHSGAAIGGGLVIVHHGGIFISSRSIIGENFTIAHDVTIGTGGQGPRDGAPVIGNNVTINAGAKVYGKIQVGDNARIGPNCVVNKSVPANALVHTPSMHVVSFGSFYASPTPPAADGHDSPGSADH
jgi:serine O-acetyltransferase